MFHWQRTKPYFGSEGMTDTLRSQLESDPSLMTFEMLVLPVEVSLVHNTLVPRSTAVLHFHYRSEPPPVAGQITPCLTFLVQDKHWFTGAFDNSPIRWDIEKCREALAKRRRGFSKYKDFEIAKKIIKDQQKK